MTTPQAIRQLNEARALNALFRGGGMSRADLARELNLTRSTTGGLVSSLIESGLLVEREVGGEGDAVRVGRPGITVDINGDGAFFLGADIGVDRIALLVLDLAGAVRWQRIVGFAGENSRPEEAARTVCGLVKEALATLPAKADIRGLSVSIPGFFAAGAETVHAIILNWHDVPVAAMLTERLERPMPILLENDANCFAVAETYRREDEAADILVILIENGVGGGIIAGGRLHRGRLRGAGEIGHIRLGEEGFVFDARRPGRFESYVGKNALLARYRYCGGAPADLDSLLRGLAGEEATAWRALRDWSHWLARGIANLVSTLEPQAVVLGGSISSALYPHVCRQVEDEVCGALIEGYPMPAIRLSALGYEGPALGAAYLLHQAMFSMAEQFHV